jgi:ribosomal protein S13
VTRCDFSALQERLQSENHTLKRALTDPRLCCGIGNACSDEILHRARLLPLALTHALDDDALRRLHEATRQVLAEWTVRLRDAADRAGGWPVKVTAFRPLMAAHGRNREPCQVQDAHHLQRLRRRARRVLQRAELAELRVGPGGSVAQRAEALGDRVDRVPQLDVLAMNIACRCRPAASTDRRQWPRGSSR